MSSYKRVKTAIARGKGGISESVRNTFLVVTVLIITATYTASLQPPKMDPKGKDESGSKVQLYSLQSTSTSPSSSSSSSASASASASSSSSSPGSVPAMASANSSANATSRSTSGVALGLALPDLYSLFWLYNTLTFWASVWLTAILLPSDCLSSLFILVTLSLFGSCYMLLIVASVSSDHQSYSRYGPLLPLDTSKWYYSISVVNYISSSLLALLVAHRVAGYVCLKLSRTRRLFLLVILFLAFLIIIVTILFPAMLFSEIMWRDVFPQMKENN